MSSDPIVIASYARTPMGGGKRGVAGICIGGGEATAMAVELI